MRIALVVAGGFDRSGREHIIPSLVSLVEQLSGRHQVTVYVLRYLREPATYSLAGAKVRDLGSPAGIIRQYRCLVAALKSDGPFDVVHGYWAVPCGFVAAAAGRRLGVPAIVTFDSGEFVALPEIDYGSQLRFRHRALTAATIRLARGVTVCSDYQARLARHHGVAPHIIPIGVDCERFIPKPVLEGPPWKLLHVASLNRVKDQVTLIRAFQVLLQRDVNAQLDIVGEDTTGGSLRKLVHDLELDDRVIFHGFHASDELVSFYQRSHVLVLSSRHEAAGVVVLEAAACGLPTVGTSVGYVADWSPDRAVAVPVGDYNALAQAIASLLADRPRRQQLAAATRGWASAHDAAWTAREFEKLYMTTLREE